MALSSKQRKVMGIMNTGGRIFCMPQRGYRYRLLDGIRNPISYVHGRTFTALLNKNLITKESDGGYASIRSTKS
jgi:hypothetical protein